MLLVGPLKDRGLGWLGAGAGSSSGGFSSSSGDEENLTKQAEDTFLFFCLQIRILPTPGFLSVDIHVEQTVSNIEPLGSF